MRASRQEQTGGAGVSEVAGAFERIGWGPAENQRHDLGTDLWLAVRDARLFDLMMMVGAQVKAGPSWFDEPAEENDELVGWWFREDRAHFDYWLGHGIPHLVVLYDLEKQVAYWVHVTPESVESTGKGAKILVPRAQTVDPEHLEALIEVAATGQAGVNWEGSIWLAGAAIPAADHLRHALMVPRLIAPHPNAGYAQPITAAQAVALLMQARLSELQHFADAFPEVPAMADAQRSEAWEWRYAAALYNRVTASDFDALVACVGDAVEPAHRAAAAAAAASALIEVGQAEQAIELMTPAIDADECSPVDHNWLLVQRARAQAEIGELDLAHRDAVEAQGTRSLAPSDASAGAVSAAAAVLLFNTSAPGERDVQDVITSADTAAGWWRAQVSSRGLGSAIDRWFDEWSNDRKVILGGEDTARNQLAAAGLTASHTGDQAGWRHLSSWQAVDQLVRMSRHADPAEAADCLTALRLAGNDKVLVPAIKHLRDDGPATGVTEAGQQIDYRQSTRTTALANLRFLRRGGDLLEEQTAAEAVRWVLSTLDDPAAFAERTQPSYLLDNELIETLSGLVAAADEPAQREVIGAVLALPAQEHQLLATAWTRVILALPDSAWTGDDAAELASGAAQHEFPLPDVLRGVAARLGDHAAQEYLVDQVRAGSLDALGALGDVTQLDSAVAAAQVASLAESVGQIVSDAHEGTHGVGSDVCRALALLNVWHPEVANWEAVVDLLADDQVAVDAKRGTLTLLADNVERIPDQAQEPLADAAQRMARREGTVVPSLFGRPRDAAAEATFLAMGLGAFDATDAAAQVVELLNGDSAHRYWAAVVAGRADSVAHRGFLISLSADDDPDVRAAACAGMARSAADQMDPLIVAALQRCAIDPGRSVAIQLAYGLEWLAKNVSDPARALTAELREELMGHPSARVRRLAAE
jgi:hypothetical protein